MSGDDGGDDSEDVDEADKGVDDGLLVSIYLRGGEGRGSVQEEGGIPLWPGGQPGPGTNV